MIWICIVACLAAAVYSWLLRRNDAVYQFLLKLVDMADVAAMRILYDESLSSDVRCEKYAKLNAIIDRYSYDRMLCSLRPLKLEAWFTEEETKILTGTDSEIIV